MKGRTIAEGLPSNLVLPKVLPLPDQFGNYWLSKGEDHVRGPAIFPSLRYKKYGKEGWYPRPELEGKYFCCDERGLPVCNGPGLRYFDSAEEALGFMRSRP